MSNNKPWGLDPMDPYQAEIEARKGKAKSSKHLTPSEVMVEVEKTKRAAFRAKLIGFVVAVALAAFTCWVFRPR